MNRISNGSLLILKNRKFRLLYLKKKLSFKIVITLMAFNILISVGILKQQTHISSLFANYYNQIVDKNHDDKDFNLLTTLNAYRTIYIENDQKSSTIINKNNQNMKLLKEYFTTSDKMASESQIQHSHEIKEQSEYLFNKNSFYDLFDHKSLKIKAKSFYEPKILINNESSCQAKGSNVIIILSLIHSHKNNYIRRQTMRDTWLRQKSMSLHDFYISNKSDSLNTQIELVHLFVLGSDDQNGFDQVKLESDLYNDIIMIDTIDSYKNLIYKHLTVINWVTNYCSNAAYVMKLDDDVFVNIKPLITRIFTTFGLNPINSKFIYCHTIKMALPQRKNVSKWFVPFDSYPFEYYPQYCEGFSYITNVNTIKLMQKQSKIIPRFWIDDVYVTGLLLYGFEQIQWFDYADTGVKWSYYDFWELRHYHRTFIDGLFNLFFKFQNIFLNKSVFDYYRQDDFVILHVKTDNKEINYNAFNDNYVNSIFLNVVNSSTQNIANSENFYAKNLTCIKYNKTNKSLTLTSHFLNCYDSDKNFFNFHFYNFCHNLFNLVK